MQEAFDNTDGIHPAESRANRPGPGKLFVTTLWSVVLRAGNESEPESAAALERLCRQYWQPLYVFARRKGHSEHDAQDLTQGFLAELLAKNSIARAEPSRGRFRSFLLAAFCHYLANQRREEITQKRGGGQVLTSLDDVVNEGVRQLSDGLTPEFHYERSWAFSLLEQVLARLREEYSHAGRLELFETLQPSLSGSFGQPGYAELGRSIGLSEGTVAVAMHRMRRRYGEFLRAGIASTVSSPDEVEAELRHLLKIVSTASSSGASV
jgi:RNA polymerase sigma-70 factor (ECF subfamily)